MQDNEAVAMHTGAVVNGVQREAEVLMRRHTPETWPKLTDGLDKWEAIVKAMDAKDIELPVQAIAMSPVTGGLYNKAKNPAGDHPGIMPTRTALSHFVGFAKEAPDMAVANLEFYSTETRARMFTELAKSLGNRNVNLRTAVKGELSNGQSERVIRAVVSDAHSMEHGDDLSTIAQLRRALGGVNDTRIRVVKQWDNTHVEIVVPNKVIEVKRGVVIQARINLENSETKGGSFEASVGSMNLVCTNGMIAGGNKSNISIRHMGDIRYKMLASIQTVTNLLDEHLAQFSEAYKAALPMTRAEAIERTAKRYKLTDKTLGASLTALWDIDGERSGGDTVAGLANALTRYAQQLPVAKALEVESVAGRVVSDGLSALV